MVSGASFVSGHSSVMAVNHVVGNSQSTLIPQIPRTSQLVAPYGSPPAWATVRKFCLFSGTVLLIHLGPTTTM